jgi:hypothetical protein
MPQARSGEVQKRSSYIDLLAWVVLVAAVTTCWLVHDARVHPTPPTPEPCSDTFYVLSKYLFVDCPSGGHLELLQNGEIAHCICPEKKL